MSLSSLTSTLNHSPDTQSHGDTEGNEELLKAVADIIISGPKR